MRACVCTLNLAHTVVNMCTSVHGNLYSVMPMRMFAISSETNSSCLLSNDGRTFFGYFCALISHNRQNKIKTKSPKNYSSIILGPSSHFVIQTNGAQINDVGTTGL